MDIKSDIDDLFRYLKTYDTNYSKFETEAFMQTYNGIRTVFQTLREQRNQAVEVDYSFLDAVKLAPLTSSDLRHLTVQMLITYFESVADVDGRSNQAYDYCRGLRAVKQDVPFFETILLPLFFREGSLNDNFRLHSFLLGELANFLNKYGRPVNADLSPEAFAAYDDGRKFLELARRRLQLGSDLMADRSSLEFHLQRVGTFDKLSQRKKLFKEYLMQWNYLVKVSFWSKIKSFFGELGGKAKGFFSSFRYTRLVFSQRRPAFFLLTFFVILWLFLAVMIPVWWLDYEKGQLDELYKRVERLK
ncbi:MAG: hypothetical protein ABIJ12_15455 [bacterium]